MNDAELQAGVATASDSPPAPPVPLAPLGAAAPVAADSFGQALAAARQARGLSQSDVAARLRLQLRQVRALEAEDFGALPQGPFVRGFVRNYARLLGVPAEPLLALLAARVQPTEPLPVGQGRSAAPNPVRLAAREQASRIAVLGGAVAALLLFAVLGWWTMRADGPRPEPSAGAGGISTGAAEPATPPADAPAAPPPAAGSAEEQAGAVSPASPTALRFAFRDQSWVEVRQADGTVLLSQINEPGTTVAVDGQPPYSVVVGNASKVDLEFGGRLVDLTAAASRDDVARLRLAPEQR